MLPVRSCLIDGEAVVCNERGLAVLDLIREYRHDAAAVLCAFDQHELDGEDLRRAPIGERKRILTKLLSHPHEGIAFNKHYTGDGAIIYKHNTSMASLSWIIRMRAVCLLRLRGAFPATHFKLPPGKRRCSTPTPDRQRAAEARDRLREGRTSTIEGSPRTWASVKNITLRR